MVKKITDTKARKEWDGMLLERKHWELHQLLDCFRKLFLCHKGNYCNWGGDQWFWNHNMLHLYKKSYIWSRGVAIYKYWQSWYLKMKTDFFLFFQDFYRYHDIVIVNSFGHDNHVVKIRGDTHEITGVFFLRRNILEAEHFSKSLNLHSISSRFSLRR